MSEVWLPIPGYDGYRVSDLGNVMSLNYARSGVAKQLKPLCFGKEGNIYPRVNLRGHKHIHSLVMLAFHGPRPAGFEVNHINGDKNDNRLTNLEYCSSSDNVLHAYRRGLKNPLRGENHPGAKFSLAAILEMKNKVEAGALRKEVAQEYGVHPGYLGRLLNGVCRAKEISEYIQGSSNG